ncbi:MAG: hypothetical protein JO115_15885 [Pseudonocardiales bacterium]|nr:hypothetical protein [Pseudonocardiales bacterium]
MREITTWSCGVEPGSGVHSELTRMLTAQLVEADSMSDSAARRLDGWRDSVVSPQRARPAQPHLPAYSRQLWGWSRVDAREHAIDPNAEHPALVYLARCGHRVLRQTTVSDVPQNQRCPSCTRGADR